MWKIRAKHSYLHLQSKTIWEIPNLENVILWLQFFFLVHVHSVPNWISEVGHPKQGVQLKDSQHSLVNVPFLEVRKYILISS